MIELYIENEKIDLRDDIEINFNYESIDPNKLSNIKNSFTKTITINGTPNNNKAFGHLFRFDKYIPVDFSQGDANIGNNYNPRKKCEWHLNKNGFVINNGYCTLNDIIIKNNKEIEYNLTLYGGLGEFFYNLSYNSDNESTPKMLSNLFWNWKPKLSLNGNGDELTKEEEDTKTLYRASAEIISQSYHLLQPTDDNGECTNINEDVVFIPCYTGYYEDFDSKHCIVSTYNHQAMSNNQYLSPSTRENLTTAFPFSYTEDGKTYRAINYNYESGLYNYGLATFSRDLDPWEVGDIRASEMPIAIRLSKLMNVISNPANNGEYSVIWDNKIKQSPYWLYSWIILGKIQTSEKRINISQIEADQYDNYKNIYKWIAATHSGEQYQALSHNMTLSSTVIDGGNYNLNINYNPVELNCKGTTAYIYGLIANNFSSSMFNKWKSGNKTAGYQLWFTPVVIHKVYDGNTLIKNYADVIYFSKTMETFGVLNNNPNLNTFAETKLRQRLQTDFGTFDEIKYNNVGLNFNGSEDITGGGKNIKFLSDKIKLSHNFNYNSSINNLIINENVCLAWTLCEWRDDVVLTNSGIFNNVGGAPDNPTPSASWGGTNLENAGSFINYYYYNNENVKSTSLFELPDSFAVPNVDFSFSLDLTNNNGLITNKTTGFAVPELTKENIFANASTPFKYFADFIKMMNYKIFCDNIEKKIYIYDLKNYYIENIIKIDDRVDYSRAINIKPVTANSKIINVGLSSPETYPIELYNRINRDKFLVERFSTQIEYPAKEDYLLNDLIYKNYADWQQSSIYYNIFPQYPRAFDTQTINWALFDIDSEVGKIEKKEINTIGANITQSNITQSYDFLPKQAHFDKSNKYVSGGNSLVFLNGFVKNYDYTNVSYKDGYTEETYKSIVLGKYINSSGVETSTTYQDLYVYFYDNSKNYYLKAWYTAGYTSYAVNYFDSNNTFLGHEFLQTSQTYDYEKLTPLPNTYYIKVNVIKSHSADNEGLYIDNYSNHNVISPRVSISNDIIEQYTLTNGRCYIYDFKYNDLFTSWGRYSYEQQSSASPWILPYFSKDLFNVYNNDNWSGTTEKIASWNFTYQPELDNIVNINNVTFVSNQNYNYTKTMADDAYISNEYNFGEYPKDNITDIDGYKNIPSRIYNTNWLQYLTDIHARTGKDITAYINLTGLGSPNQLMRYIYSWNGGLYIITKLDNYKEGNINKDKFTKVTLHKIFDKNIWVE